MSDNTAIDHKAVFIEQLLQVDRENLDKVVEALEKIGFFDSPASAKHHLAEPGGLVKHSLNVYRQALAIAKAQCELDPDVEKRLPNDSLAIVSLLHDVCKAGVYKEELKHRKNPDGRWEDYIGYTADYSSQPLGHGEKSVIRLLRMGLNLTNDEILAIRWHMGGWDLADSYEAKGNFSSACEKCPLLSVLIAADELATRITERQP